LTDILRQLEYVNVSDTGLKRPHNEDSSLTDEALGIAVVADGMGGYKAGEVASAIAVAIIMHELRTELRKRQVRGKPGQAGLTAESMIIRDAITKANQLIYKTAQEDPQCQGMGTTVAMMLFYENGFSAAHVGDSRIYRLREGVFKQLSVDHSLIQELIDRGFFTAEEANANTPKNLVTRALGIEHEVEVDIQEDLVQIGDIYLMCSDGLTDMVADPLIRTTLLANLTDLPRAGAELIRLANAAGGKDNCSIVMVRVREEQAAPPGGDSFFGRLLRKFKGK